MTGAAGRLGQLRKEATSKFGDKATLEIRDLRDQRRDRRSPSFSNCDVDGLSGHQPRLQRRQPEPVPPDPIAGDRHGLDPKLGPLQDNGGPTRTMAPLSGSPLIDGGPSICQSVRRRRSTTDQRGDPRGTPCDIGAYEAIAPAERHATGGQRLRDHRPDADVRRCGLQRRPPQTIDTVWLRDGQQAATGRRLHDPRRRCRPRDSRAARLPTNAYGSAIGGQRAPSR